MQLKKEFKKLFIEYKLIFIGREWKLQFMISCKVVWYVNNISGKIFTKLVFCSHYQFQKIFGQIFQWTLSKVCLRSGENLCYLWWWIAYQSIAHFLPLAHLYTTISVAKVFSSHIFRLHGLPKSIVSDQDVVFTSIFWKELFRLSGTQLSFSSAYHPRTDGQTKVVTRTIEMYLCCFMGDTPRKWVEWLHWAEYCYNTSFHTALCTTPFQLVYGRPPPRLLSYEPGSTRIDAVDSCLQNRDEFWLQLVLIYSRLKSVWNIFMMHVIKICLSVQANLCGFTCSLIDNVL